MSLTAEIARTYRSPGAVVRSQLARGRREDRALLVLMLACGLIFVAQWPRLSREAQMTERPLEILLGGALMGWVFLAPLLLYGLAALSIVALRAAGRPAVPFAARFALFWALLAAAPLWLVHGLVAGLVGPGLLLDAVGALALAAFLWFWWSGLGAAGGEKKKKKKKSWRWHWPPSGTRARRPRRCCRWASRDRRCFPRCFSWWC